MAADLIAGTGAGLLLAANFNPVTAVAGAVLGAGLATTGRVRAAVLVVALAWAAGDGMLLLARASEVRDGGVLVEGTGAAGSWVAIALWALVGAAVGYAAPAWAGAFVGRRVTHGTGWLAAGAVAATASGALMMLGGAPWG